MKESNIILFPGVEKESSAEVAYLSRLQSEIDELIRIQVDLDELVQGMSPKFADGLTVMKSEPGEEFSVKLVLLTVRNKMAREVAKRFLIIEDRVKHPSLDI